MQCAIQYSFTRHSACYTLLKSTQQNATSRALIEDGGTVGGASDGQQLLMARQHGSDVILNISLATAATPRLHTVIVTDHAPDGAAV